MVPPPRAQRWSATLAGVHGLNQYTVWAIDDRHTVGELALLRCIGSVTEFFTKFMTISCRGHSLTEQQQIQLFTISLGDPLRTDAALQWPVTLDEVVLFMRAYEQRPLSPILLPSPMPQSSDHSTLAPWSPAPVSTLTSSVISAAPPASITSSVHQDADYQAVVHDRNRRSSGEGPLLQM
jgi:hypothetical protein